MFIYQLLAYRHHDTEGMVELEGNEYPARFSPDGLTEQIIDALLREVDGAAVAMPHPTSALMDGTAAQHQYQREARRRVSAVVRALPLRGVGSGPDGLEAA